MKRLIVILGLLLSVFSLKASRNVGSGTNVPIWVEVTFDGVRGIRGSISDYNFYAVLGTNDTTDL